MATLLRRLFIPLECSLRHQQCLRWLCSMFGSSRLLCIGRVHELESANAEPCKHHLKRHKDINLHNKNSTCHRSNLEAAASTHNETIPMLNPTKPQSPKALVMGEVDSKASVILSACTYQHNPVCYSSGGIRASVPCASSSHLWIGPYFCC